MTASSAVLSPGVIWGFAQTGSSDAAIYVEKSFEASLEHYLEPRLAQVFFPIADVFAATQNEEVPVTEQVVQMAMNFASQLPLSARLPDISADPDGEIAFDWSSPSGKMFSVSISGSGVLSYAGWF